MRKIKLLVDAHVFDNDYQQGTTTYINGLYNSLVDNSAFDITLCSHNLDKLRGVFSDSRFNFLKLSKSNKFKRLLIDYPRLIKEHSFDFAHFQYVTPPVKKCKYINTIHDVLFLEYPQYFPLSYRLSKNFLFSNSAKNSNLIFTVSEYSKNALAQHYNINPDEIYITNNAVEANKKVEFIDIKLKYDLGSYLLYVGRFEPRKNHYSLLKAFLQLELYKKGLHLVLIGKRNSVETEAFNNYLQQISEELKNFIHIFENVPQNDLDNFYQQAELFVYPSLAEGFGIPPIEAAINNCKVVCSNTTAMKDFNFFPYRFDPNDINEMKTSIVAGLNDKNYPFAKVRDQVIQKYNWQVVAQDFGNAIINSIDLKTSEI